MNDANDINAFFTNELTSQYADSVCRILRNSSARISAECEHMINSEAAQGNQEISDSVNRIFSDCRRLMQMPLYFEMMSSFLSDSNDRISETRMSFLAHQFKTYTEKALGDMCSIAIVFTDKCTMRINESSLTFILVSFVRCAVIDGARAINADFRCETKYSDDLSLPPERNAVIHLKASEFAEPDIELTGDFMYANFASVVKAFAEKYSLGYELSKDCIKLILPVSSADESYFAHSKRTELDNADAFMYYNVYLNELNPDSYI